MERVKAILIEKAQKSIELAKQSILQEDIEYEPIREALCYFMEEVWFDASHPTLLSLACEAVGGDPDSTTAIGAAIVLLAGGADVHDDIIDQSMAKDSKPTVLGKFGTDIAILVGDALLFKGLLMLYEACEPLSKEKKTAILKLAKTAFFEIGNAEAQEASLRRKLDLNPDEYLDIIKKKVSVAETAARMGALLGNGTPESVEIMGDFGRTIGLLMTIRDEFIDVFEMDELRNRYEHECLPLPVLYAFQDDARKKELIQLIERKELSQEETQRITDLVINAETSHALVRYMHLLIKKENLRLRQIPKCSDSFSLLLKSTLEDLPY